MVSDTFWRLHCVFIYLLSLYYNVERGTKIMYSLECEMCAFTQPNWKEGVEKLSVGWLRLAGSIKLQVSFAKEPYKREDILQKRLII